MKPLLSHRFFTTITGVLALLFSLFTLVFPPGTRAEESPSGVVLGTIAKLQETLGNTKLSPKERMEILHAVVFKHLDVDRLTDRILQPYKGKDKEENLETFRALYREYIDIVYLRQIEKLRGKKVVIASSVQSGEKDATVKAKIYLKDDDDMTVSFFLNVKDGNWKIYDIDFGIGWFSKSEFYSLGQRILREGGMEEMFTVMREKIEWLRRQNSAR